ncbi:hypothetical protein QJS66_17200 [Kocuria rhizophila]|nr:hypothetical protein QJS66_17200 [Kocuria rhizophila]
MDQRNLAGSATGTRVQVRPRRAPTRGPRGLPARRASCARSSGPPNKPLHLNHRSHALPPGQAPQGRPRSGDGKDGQPRRRCGTSSSAGRSTTPADRGPAPTHRGAAPAHHVRRPTRRQAAS